MSRRSCAAGITLLVLAGLGGCATRPDPGAFNQAAPTSPASPASPAHLDREALLTIEAALQTAAGAHLSADGVDAGWGGGALYAGAGPYRDVGTTRAALALLAASRAHDGPLAAAVERLRAAALGGGRQLDGPQGALYLLLARADGYAAVDQSACPPSVGDARAALRCLRVQVAHGLRAAWYASDTRTFFHVGDPTTVYRPVEAFAVGCALIVAGYAEHDFDTITAGLAIVDSEMRHDLDEHFGMVHGVMSATAAGGRSAIGQDGLVADQAGIAEMLLEAFDASREAVLRDDAARLLTPFVEERAQLRNHGYLSRLDLTGSGTGAGPVDVEAGLLVLQAAHHFDALGGTRFSRLEETAQAEVLASACAAGVACSGEPAPPVGMDGLPGAVGAGAPTGRSGLVTVLGLVVIEDVLSG